MTDRELLEWAAKAAGLVTYGLADKFLVEPGHRTGGFIVGTPTGRDVPWNPLTDDGDALRLAVKLRLDVHCFASLCEVFYGPRREMIREDGGSYKATRRAIVRAAAAIGQSMETQSEKNARFRKALDEMPIAEPPHPRATL
jgi:hypothetical protein